MRPVTMCLSALLFSVAATSAAQAQIKLPVFNENKNIKNVTFEEARTPADFRHGMLVRVELNGETAQGRLVRVDAKNGRVYVRTEPGAAPRAFAVKEIRKLEKGVIRTVNYQADAVQPEIRELLIFNGGKRTVTYAAPTLSPGEMLRLSDLENAENELTRLETIAAAQRTVLENDVAIQSEQLRAQELVNDLLRREYVPNSYVYHVPANSIYWGPYGFPTVGAQAVATERWPGYPNFPNLAATPVPFVRTGTVFPASQLDPAALASARRNLLSLQHHGIYEDGRLVAVLPDEAGK